jgi:hypothetical protein
MSTARAARGLLAIAILLAVALPGMPGAHAQGSPTAALTLLRETPWNTLKHPELRLVVRATNAAASPLSDLTLGVTIGAAIRSRNAYEASLTEGPGLPIFATTIAESGSLAPGDRRRFHVSVDLSSIGGVSTIDSLVYPLRVDLRSRSVTVAGATVALRTLEFELLAELTQRAGQVVTRDRLLDRVWGLSFAGGTRTVDVHVAQLRKKLGRPELIQTVRGVGYRILERQASREA